MVSNQNLRTELLKEHATEFDKYLVSISSGGIVFVLLFSKQVFDSKEFIVMPLLGLGTVPLFFGITILSVILSIYLSQKRYALKVFRPNISNDNIETKIAIFNFLALSFFISGFISACIFGVANILGILFPKLLELGEQYEPYSGLLISIIAVLFSLALIHIIEPKSKKKSQ